MLNLDHRPFQSINSLCVADNGGLCAEESCSTGTCELTASKIRRRCAPSCQGLQLVILSNGSCAVRADAELCAGSQERTPLELRFERGQTVAARDSALAGHSRPYLVADVTHLANHPFIVWLGIHLHSSIDAGSWCDVQAASLITYDGTFVQDLLSEQPWSIRTSALSIKDRTGRLRMNRTGTAATRRRKVVFKSGNKLYYARARHASHIGRLLQTEGEPDSMQPSLSNLRSAAIGTLDRLENKTEQGACQPRMVLRDVCCGATWTIGKEKHDKVDSNSTMQHTGYGHTVGENGNLTQLRARPPFRDRLPHGALWFAFRTNVPVLSRAGAGLAEEEKAGSFHGERYNDDIGDKFDDDGGNHDDEPACSAWTCPATVAHPSRASFPHPRLVIFNRVPKCGSTSFEAIIKRQAN